MTEAYARVGVDYGPLDDLKRIGQKKALETYGNLPAGMYVVEASLGESALVIDMGPFDVAINQEGLGTKNLIADMYGIWGNAGAYRNVTMCTVAAIVNDLLTVGARPLVAGPDWTFGGNEFLKNKFQNGVDIVQGWTDACNEAQAVYGAGETAIHAGTIYPTTVDLSGSGFGFIFPKERLTLGEKLQAGDHIILIGSSGVHANGLTLVRESLNDSMSYSVNTKLPSGRTFGEALLTPTYIYAKLQQALFEKGVDIHYMVNITGHGWAKIMRAKREFTYRIHTVPQPQEEFRFIQIMKKLYDTDMYTIFNMGAGFAFMVPPADAPKVIEEAAALGFKSWDAGLVEEGKKQVIIEPKKIIFDQLSIR
jgi:phosphoribosylformylglycinamidine cyclo-ligase